MDISAYPHIAAIIAHDEPRMKINLGAEILAELNTTIDQLMTHMREKEYWDDFTYTNLPAEFHDIIELAFSHKIISLETADSLIRSFQPFADYTDLIRSKRRDFKITDYQAAQLNVFKSDLDKREPGKWLPNQPDVPTLLDKVEEWGNPDTLTLIMLRATLTYFDNDLPFVLKAE